jgi:hypothetical protein
VWTCLAVPVPDSPAGSEAHCDSSGQHTRSPHVCCVCSFACLSLQVFYHGGTKANSPGAVNSLNLEVLDLQSLSPLVVEAQCNPKDEVQISSRFSHQLVTWDNRLLLFGGRQEDSAGVTGKDDNQDDNQAIWMFDLNNRTWSRLQPGTTQLPKSELYSSESCRQPARQQHCVVLLTNLVPDAVSITAAGQRSFRQHHSADNVHQPGICLMRKDSMQLPSE